MLLSNIPLWGEKLRKTFKTANPEGKKGLKDLRDEHRKEISSLRKAEQIRKRKRNTARKRAAFIANPYQFSKKLFENERSGCLSTSMQDIEKHLESVHADPLRNEPLRDCQRILPVDTPETPFDSREPTFTEIKEVVKKSRSCSAPGPNGIPYKVYKQCPSLLRKLWQLLKVIWRKGTIPPEWQTAEGIFTPKEKDSKDVTQFRTISLLNVEGKIFFSVLSRRLTSYLLNNKYIDTAVQKGGVPGFSGCIEHTSAISQLIREAKVNKSDLTVVWLDLANAYGTVPHQLIETALKHYHVPSHIQGIIVNYLQGIKLRFKVGDQTTKWQNLEKGIVTGCTISVVLFVMGMNLLNKAASAETRGPKTNTGERLTPNRAFVDDLTVTTQTHVQARWILAALEETATWARMKFKPTKSRSLIIRKGKQTDRFILKIQGEDIPSITDNPVKCLGKWFDDSLNDRANVQRIKTQLTEGMQTIDRSGLPGKFKAWLFQHGLLPRLMWPLMLYEITTTTVESLERTISKYLRRWLGVPPSFTSIGLYGKTNQLQLPLSSLSEEFKVAKARMVVTLKQSKDKSIQRAGIETCTGRKWSASSAVERAESQLQLKDNIGTTAIGRQGLGTSKTTRWSTANDAEKRAMIQAEIRQEEEQSRKAKSVSMAAQGAWTKWPTSCRKLSWSDIWSYQPLRLAFLLKSVYDVLPSPTNLHRWGLHDDPSCKLCNKAGSLEHILSSCATCLSQGRYRWRHDTVLRSLADSLEKERVRKRPKQTGNSINFVREGQTPHRNAPDIKSILSLASDWKMSADLDKKLIFPSIVQTTLRPDIVIWSESQKAIIMIELTVPWETRCEEAHERKSAKYAHLVEEVKEKGWKSWLFPVEIGTRGFPAQSLWKLLTALGMRGSDRKKTVSSLCRTAEQASNWLWLRREETSWKPNI